MDEYLSKPLKQNHMIQTILKCATLGGALLEKGRDIRSSAKDETPMLASSNGVPTPVLSPGNLRPGIEARAVTTTGPISHGSLERYVSLIQVLFILLNSLFQHREQKLT